MKIAAWIVLLTAFAFFTLGGLAFGQSAGFLRVAGDRVLDASGRQVMLKGFNVVYSDLGVIPYRKAIRMIKATGANCIRLAIDYRSFESAPFRYNERSFAILSRILDWCGRYRIFVILDMHLLPGIQNPHDFISHQGEAYEFWSLRKYQERYYALLAEFARRFHKRTILAAYDLMNEGVPPDAETYREVLNRAAKTVRSFDKNHILVVEEAILAGEGKRLFIIDDRNTLYSIHFYFPREFTLYAVSTDRAVTHYPGEVATVGNKISEIYSEPIEGTHDWKKAVIRAVPPEGAEIFTVSMTSDRNRGAVWYDDISLTVNGRPVDLPAPLVRNGSFEESYRGFAWNLQGSCVAVGDGPAKTGRRSLTFSRCQAPSSASGSPIEATKGEYVVAAWERSSGATGDNRLVLSWFGKKIMFHLDKTVLHEQMEYALEFGKLFNVPLYVGEFTAQANPEEESVLNYLSDLLQIMQEEGLHWTYWEYLSDYPGTALYSAHLKPLRPDALDVLRKYLKK